MGLSLSTRSASDVGQFITFPEAKKMKAAFRRRNPEFPEATVISRDLIQSCLESSPAVNGIQFLFGLNDEAKLDSLDLNLVANVQAGLDASSRSPLLPIGGFAGKSGKAMTHAALSLHNRNFIQWQVANREELDKTTAHRSNFFGRNSLESVIDFAGCTDVRFSFGFKSGYVQLILEPLDAAGKTAYDVVMDFGSPEPPPQNGDWWF